VDQASRMMRTLLTLSLLYTLGCQAAEININQLLADIQRERDLQSSPLNELAEDYYNGGESDPGEVIMQRVRKGAGNCYAKGKCLYYSKRMKAEFCGACGRRPGCFPGNAHVLKESGEVISMDQLRVNDRVLAASRSGVLTFSPVVSWLDKRSNDTTQYLELTVQQGQRIVLSSNHVLLVREGDQLVSRFAGQVQPGDVLKVAESLDTESWSPVISSRPVLATGAFVPLTAEGTIVVDGVLASCYASFDHDWAHALTAPIRWFPALFEAAEDRDADGPRAAVEMLKEFGRWLFSDPGSKHRAAVDDSVVQIPLMALPQSTAQ